MLTDENEAKRLVTTFLTAADGCANADIMTALVSSMSIVVGHLNCNHIKPDELLHDLKEIKRVLFELVIEVNEFIENIPNEDKSNVQ